MPLPGSMIEPPAPPPEVTAQMGAGRGLQAVANRQQGAVNPHGQLIAQADTVKAVLEQMAGIEPVFSPFARQAIAAITDGVSAVSAAPPLGLPNEMPERPTPAPVGAGMPPLA